MLLRVSRETGRLTCLFAKAALDESNLWHRRLGPVNFKTMNKLVKGNLGRGLPSKVFENNHTCVSCKKGKQHKASCKSKPVSSVSQPLQRHITHRPSSKSSNLPPKVTVVKAPVVSAAQVKQGTWVPVVSVAQGKQRTWTKVQPQRPTTHGVNKAHLPKRRPINHRPSPPASNFHQKVTTSKASQVNAVKGVKRNWGNPQHALKDKGVIDSGCSRHITRNMSYLIDFEEINGGYVAFGGNPNGGKITDTECIVLSSDFKLPDENHAALDESNLWHRRLGPVNFKTMNKLVKGNLGRGLPSKVFENNHTCVSCKKGKQHKASCKFDGKTDEGFLVGYSVSRSGPTWLFDIDTLTKSMNYQPVTAGDQPNPSAVKEPEFEVKEPESKVHVSPSSSAKTKKHDDKTKREAKGKSPVDTLVPAVGQISTNNTNPFSTAGPSNTVVSPTLRKSLYVDPSQYPYDPNMLALEDITYSDDEEDVGAKADFSNLETNIPVSHIPTTRVHKDHHVTQIIGVLSSAPQTRSMTSMVKEQGGASSIQDAKGLGTSGFPKGKRAIGSKWVFLNKKDERGIVIRNKGRLVAQGHTQEECIDYEEVFAPVARIEAIRLFLAYASFMGFMVYQMDVKSAFLYETIKEEVYVCQPIRFEDPDYHDKVYVEDIIFGSTNKDLCKAFEKLMKDKFKISSTGELTFFLALQVKQKQDGIFISQDKYVAEILRKCGLTDGKSASTPIDTEKPLLKDPNASLKSEANSEDVDVHTY
nr:hypothetical protein [Tanacetum cinerariifolium]